jgi:hypothetical protein
MLSGKSTAEQDADAPAEIQKTGNVEEGSLR